MTALSVGYIQTYRDSVDSLGESVDMSIKVCVCVCACGGHKFMRVHLGCWLHFWKMKEVTACRE